MYLPCGMPVQIFFPFLKIKLFAFLLPSCSYLCVLDMSQSFVRYMYHGYFVNSIIAPLAFLSSLVILFGAALWSLALHMHSLVFGQKVREPFIWATFFCAAASSLGFCSADANHLGNPEFSSLPPWFSKTAMLCLSSGFLVTVHRVPPGRHPGEHGALLIASSSLGNQSHVTLL